MPLSSASLGWCENGKQVLTCYFPLNGRLSASPCRLQGPVLDCRPPDLLRTALGEVGLLGTFLLRGLTARRSTVGAGNAQKLPGSTSTSRCPTWLLFHFLLQTSVEWCVLYRLYQLLSTDWCRDEHKKIISSSSSSHPTHAPIYFLHVLHVQDAFYMWLGEVILMFTRLSLGSGRLGSVALGSWALSPCVLLEARAWLGPLLFSWPGVRLDGLSLPPPGSWS